MQPLTDWEKVGTVAGAVTGVAAAVAGIAAAVVAVLDAVDKRKKDDEKTQGK